MKLSTKGRYGLKALINIGYYQNKGPVSLKSIAEIENISEGYLEQLIKLLKEEEMVTSTRGKNGGYVLSKNPKDIYVGDILKILEGTINVVDCISEDGKCECSAINSCSTKLVWQKISEAINNVVYSISLDDLIEDYKKGDKNVLF